MFCFSEDPVQKIVEHMEPPCAINTKTEGVYALKQEHDQFKCFSTFITLSSLSYSKWFLTV